MWVGLTVVALVVLLYAEAMEHGSWMRVAKPLASLGFIGHALSHGAMDSGYGQWVALALVLSMIGDVCLLSKRPQMFLGGLVAFALAHVGYVAAFVGRGPSWLVVFAALGGLSFAALKVYRWLSPHVQDDMRRPVQAYTIIITLMVATALGATLAGAGTAITLGAVMFYLSDLSVARDRFVHPGFVNRLWGLPLYYTAQLVLAGTV